MARTRNNPSDLESYKNKKNNIAIYRTKAGYSQLDCAEQLGVSQQYFSQYEHSKHFPRSYEIDYMLDLFGTVTFDELFNTGRFTTYISNSNLEKVDNYIKDQEDSFPAALTEFEKRSMIINQIIGLYLDEKLNK